jgi:hypothetical protein
MRRILAVLLVAVVLVASTAPAAHAGGHGPGRGVIGLAAFALFAPLFIVGEVLAHTVPRVVVAPAPVYYQPAYQPAPVYQAPAPAYYPPPPAYSAPPAYQAYAAPAPAQPRVIQYPHGRYVLRGDGAVTAYHWVWIPNPPIPPPPAAPPPPPPAGSP